MNLKKVLASACLMLATAAAPAFAQQTIVSPTNGEQVSSPFTLNMWANYCASLPVSAVGYSLDSSPNTSSWPTWYIDGPVAAPSGWHTLHVKVWNNRGGICVTDISINVTGGASGASSGNSVVPWNAVRNSDIQAMGNWISIHDGGTPGWSSGSTYVTGSPSLTGGARLFADEFNNFGGQRFSSQFQGATGEHNFFYDTWVYIANDTNGFSNLEFDLNQTLSNGLTTIMGFQCDSWNHTWDYAVNGGSPTRPWATWGHSSAYCDAKQWGANQWHHVQIFYTRNDSGWVTYHTVWLDGRAEGIDVTAFSGFELGWGASLVTNFQIDGASNGTTWSNIYLDELTVYRW